MARFGLATIDKCLRHHGAERVSRKAKLHLKKYLEEIMEKMAKEAVMIAKEERRKTVLERDVRKAIKQKTLF